MSVLGVLQLQRPALAVDTWRDDDRRLGTVERW